MTRSTEVRCDACGHDLTTRSNSVDYRLVLDYESKPGYGSGVYTDMMIYPPIDREHHFCSMGCLARWIEPQMAPLLEQQAKRDKRRAIMEAREAEARAKQAAIEADRPPMDGETP